VCCSCATTTSLVVTLLGRESGGLVDLGFEAGYKEWKVGFKL
jgi:hypothetical protein